MDRTDNKSAGNVIETHGLTKSYKQTPALKDLDLRVPRNSIFGFLGPNGAGKTTAIKLLLGLAAPTTGSATIFGMDIGRSSTDIRRRTGYLAQDPRYYEYMSARETLRFTARFFYTGPELALRERIEETLSLVGLEDKGDRPVKGFSGGERQRLGIAQAQVNYPDLLILDEPAASLDPQGRHTVLDVMERLRKYTTIFYSTHILEDVQRVSDRVAILNHGKLIAQAPIQELLSGDQRSCGFRLVVRAEPRSLDEVCARLKAQPWVTGVEIAPYDGATEYRVCVTNAEAAETLLLPLVMRDMKLQICSFGRNQTNLEDVFLSLVEGDNHDNIPSEAR